MYKVGLRKTTKASVRIPMVGPKVDSQYRHTNNSNLVIIRYTQSYKNAGLHTYIYVNTPKADSQ